jgi:hypothetical protein
MGAIRLARAFTGRSKIIKVGGDFHGWADQMVYSLRLPKTTTMEAVGIPNEVFTHIQETFPNDIACLKEIMAANEECGGTAALEAERIAKVAADAEAKLKADAAKVAAAKVAKVAAAKLKAETAAKAKAEAEAKAKAEAAAKLKAEAAAKVSGDLEEESVENSDSDDEEDDGVEVEVKAWTHKGKKYLKSTLNKVYDSKTQKPIGMWNEETDTIDPLDEEEEEDEEEEDEEEDE